MSDVIPIGIKVIIKKNSYAPLKYLEGMTATVIGYEKIPPTAITLHQLRVDGDVMFKWPKVFTWEVEVVPMSPTAASSPGDRPASP